MVIKPTSILGEAKTRLAHELNFFFVEYEEGLLTCSLVLFQYLPLQFCENSFPSVLCVHSRRNLTINWIIENSVSNSDVNNVVKFSYYINSGHLIVVNYFSFGIKHCSYFFHSPETMTRFM